nr:ribonuclease H-like domain-containing protein [Tanacetum cinerariifolium]
ASQAVKKDVSSLRYIALPNWFHEAHMETRNSDGYNANDPESSGISNPTATLKVPLADQVEPAVSLIVEFEIPTVSSPVPTVCLDISPKSSSDPRLISKGDFSQKETPSLGNALTLSNRFEDTFGMEADLSNMETSIPASLTPTFRIHKDHPKSQIIGPVDTPEEPKKIFDALKDSSWVEAMQEELLQFKIQNVWILVDCPKGVRPIGTKWALKNKKDERCIVIRNKARLVAQGYTQEEGIYYEEVFTPVVRIEAIRLFLAYASFMGFIIYKMDVKSVFLYGTIDEEVYVMQPPRFQDLEFPDKYARWRRLCMDFIRHLEPGMGKDGPGKDVELHLYRSMIGSLMYLTASRPDIMFAVCVCARHQVTPKECHLHDVKRIFRYLKDSDYGDATQDRKSTTGGCQFLERRLISWQCKKQTIVATSTTEAEYVAAASGCGQVLWIQNQMLDYGNFIMAKLAFCDYHNMIAILEKTEHNIDFHEIVDFLEASHLRIETTNQETNILATVDGKPRTISESSLRRHLKLSDEEGISSLPDTELFENPSLMGYNILPNQRFTFQKGQFSHQWKDDSQGEDFPTVSSLDAGQDRENINKTSALPHKSSPMVTSLDADEGRGIKEIREEVGADKITELGSNDTEEMVNVLSLMEAANIMTSGVAAASVSPAEVLSAVGVPTVSGNFPTVSAIFTTASVVTPYTRQPKGIIIGGAQQMRSPIVGAKDKGKQKVVESELARDSEIARLHAEEELKMIIKGMDRSNEVIAKHLQEYKQYAVDLSVGEKIELINELVKYQDHRTKILKYQAQQSKPLSKKEQREFYMSVLRSHAGWKTKHFRGMILEQLKEKFTPVWKQFKDFVCGSPLLNGSLTLIRIQEV